MCIPVPAIVPTDLQRVKSGQTSDVRRAGRAKVVLTDIQRVQSSQTSDVPRAGRAKFVPSDLQRVQSDQTSDVCRTGRAQIVPTDIQCAIRKSVGRTEPTLFGVEKKMTRIIKNGLR